MQIFFGANTSDEIAETNIFHIPTTDTKLNHIVQNDLRAYLVERDRE